MDRYRKGDVIKFRGSSEYEVLLVSQTGYLVAEALPNLNRVVDVKYFRNEFLEECLRKGLLIPPKIDPNAS